MYYLPFSFNSEQKYLLNTDVFLMIAIYCSKNGSITLFIFFLSPQNPFFILPLTFTARFPLHSVSFPQLPI